MKNRMCLALVAIVFASAEAFADFTSVLKNSVLIETEFFAITEYDLYMYSSASVDPESGKVDWGSREAVREALQQLYALNVLSIDAESRQTLTASEREWYAKHEVNMLAVKRFLSEQVEREVASIEFETLASEYYIANKSDFVLPERRSLRALLVSTDCRTPEQALSIATDMLRGVTTEAAFETLIREKSEDPVGAAKGGLMIDVKRGDTVEPFEKVLFSLQSAGEISTPFISEFGAHVIQLISVTEEKQLVLAEVRDQIIRRLEREERNNILATLRMEARERRPAGLELHMDALNKIVDSTESLVGAAN